MIKLEASIDMDTTTKWTAHIWDSDQRDGISIYSESDNFAGRFDAFKEAAVEALSKHYRKPAEQIACFIRPYDATYGGSRYQVVARVCDSVDAKELCEALEELAQALAEVKKTADAADTALDRLRG